MHAQNLSLQSALRLALCLPAALMSVACGTSFALTTPVADTPAPQALGPAVDANARVGDFETSPTLDPDEKIGGEVVHGVLVLTPSVQGAAHFVPGAPERFALTDDAPNPSLVAGTPIALTLTLHDFTSEAPIPLVGARVDVWQANGLGIYSGDPNAGTAGQTFLRGFQSTDTDGTVRFETIVPGWTAQRAPHLSVMVTAPDAAAPWVTQLFFPDAFSARAFADEPYRSRPLEPVTNERDAVYQSACVGNAIRLRCGALNQLLVTDTTGIGFAASADIFVRRSGL